MKETRHDLVDRVLGEVREEAERFLSRAATGVLSSDLLIQRAPAWTAAQDPGLAKALHEAVDRAPDLSPLSAAAYERKLTGFEVEIRGRQVEIERRAAAIQLDEAKRGMADVAAKAEA